MEKQSKNFLNNTGATTMVVICVMAVIMALSLGLFLTVSVMMKTSTRTLAGEQCRILSASFADEVEAMLTSEQYDYPDRLAEDSGRAGNPAGISIWHYVRQNIGNRSWPYLDENGSNLHNRKNAVRIFQMKREGTAGEIADITLTMYWLSKKETEEPERLVVETTVTVKEQSCTISDIYLLHSSGMGDYDKWIWEHTERK